MIQIKVADTPRGAKFQEPNATPRSRWTGFTTWNTLEVVERSELRFEIKITRCLYHELTTCVGVPELTPVICQVDNAAFNTYLPDKIVFNRGGAGHRIADGAKECKFVWDLCE